MRPPTSAYNEVQDLEPVELNMERCVAGQCRVTYAVASVFPEGSSVEVATF